MTEQELQELKDLEEMDKLERQLAGVPIDSVVKEEMPPEISTMERAIVKNLSNSPETSIKYLQEKHPELEVRDIDGHIVARQKGSKGAYGKLDPFRSIIPTSLDDLKELGRDVLDVGYDIPAGILQGAATAAGATAGGLATAPSGGGGALPAGMAASGAASAGLEALRQKLGAWAGLPQEVSGSDVAKAGLFGAAVPAVLGTGVTKAALGAAAQNAGKQLTPEMIQSVLRSGRGAVGRTRDFASEKMLPALGEMASGVPRTTTRSLQKFLPEVKQMEQTGVTQAVEDVHGRIVGGLAQAKAQVGKNLEEAINTSGKTISTATIRKPLEEAIAEAKRDAGALGNSAMNSRVEELQKIYDDLFTAGGEGYPVQVAGLGGDIAPRGKQALPDQISARAAFNLQDSLADMADLYRTGQGPQARFAAGATRGEKKTAEVMRKAYNAVNDELNTATDGLTGTLKNDYREYIKIQKDLQPFFKTPEKTFETLSTLGKKDRKMLNEKLANVEQNYNIPLVEDAQKLEAFRTFSNPALTGLSGLGTTSTSRTVPASVLGGTIGSLLGYKAGGGYAGAAVGGMGGAKLGAYLGSPDMLRKLVELDAKAASMNEAAKAYGMPPAYGLTRSAWQGLKGQDE